MHRRTLLVRAGAGAALAAGAQPSAARNPSPLRIAVGFPAGVVTDNIARLLGDALRTVYPEGVLVENRVGAGGRIAADFVKRAEDDHTLLLTPCSMMWLYPHVYRTLSYAPLTDFKPVAGIATLDYAIATGPAVPEGIRSLQDYIQWCRADRQRCNYGVPAAGSTPHFIGTVLARECGLDMTAVAYKGGAPLLRDLVGGHIPMSIDPLPNALPYHRSGKLRILATTGKQRSTSLPDVQSVAETPFSNLVAPEWYGIYAPAHVPNARILQLQHELHAAVRASQLRLAEMQVKAEILDADEFGFLIRAETERWRAVVAASGFRPED